MLLNNNTMSLVRPLNLEKSAVTVRPLCINIPVSIYFDVVHVDLKSLAYTHMSWNITQPKRKKLIMHQIQCNKAYLVKNSFALLPTTFITRDTPGLKLIKS